MLNKIVVSAPVHWFSDCVLFQLKQPNTVTYQRKDRQYLSDREGLRRRWVVLTVYTLATLLLSDVDTEIVRVS